MYGLYPKDKTFGTLHRAGHILRIHLSEYGETSLCGKANPDKFIKIERPDTNKDVCVLCLFEEQKFLYPVAPRRNKITGYIYSLRVIRGQNKDFPQYYVRHSLDMDGNTFCKQKILYPSREVILDVQVKDCEKCLFAIKSMEMI